MSAAAAEPSASTGAQAAERVAARAHPALAVLALVALLACAGLVVVAARAWTEPLDPRAELESALVVEGALPFGLEPVAGLRLPTGERVLRFARPGLDEAPRVEPAPLRADARPAGGGALADEPRVDWAKLAAGAEQQPPLELYVVLRAGRGGAAFDGAVRRFEWKDLADVGPQGGRVPLEKGELAWHGWLVDWVLERELEAGGTFRDWARVDLSPGGTSTLALLRWARGEPGSKARLEELLGALAPRAEAGASGPGAPASEASARGAR